MSLELFRCTPKIVFGNGSIKNIASEVKELGSDHAFIVTDPGIVKAGLVDILEAILKENNIRFSRFDEVEADPPYETVGIIADLYKKSNATAIIGFGGGSAQDIAKGVAVLATNEGPIEKYFGINLVPNQSAPLILVPTTAGTGSESTTVAIFSDNQEKLKKGVVSPYLLPSVALLDPELTIGVPPAITAATGMDALIHAVEAYTSVNATPMSDMLAIEAIRIINENLRTAYANGNDLEARSQMLRGSLLAGMAFATAGVTAVHAFAYPIGAEFHIPHGVANTIMFVPVMEFNYLGNLKRFAKLAEFFDICPDKKDKRTLALEGLEAIRTLALDLNVPQQLREYGVKKEDIPALSEAVLLVTRLLANNPRKVTYADAEAIYTKAL